MNEQQNIISIDTTQSNVHVSIFNGLMFKDSNASAIHRTLTTIVSGFFRNSLESIHINETTGDFTIKYGNTSDIDVLVAKLLLVDIEDEVKAPMLLSSYIEKELTQLTIDIVNEEEVTQIIISDFEVEPNNTEDYKLQDTKTSFDCKGTITTKKVGINYYSTDENEEVIQQIDQAIKQKDFATVSKAVDQIRAAIQYRLSKVKPKPKQQKNLPKKHFSKSDRKKKANQAKASKRRNRA